MALWPNLQKLLGGVGLASALCLTGCGSDDAPASNPAAAAGGEAGAAGGAGAAGSSAGSAGASDVCNSPQRLTWANFADGHMRNYCVGCHSSQLGEGKRHGAPTGVDFDSYTAAMQWQERIEARAAGDPPTMPPGGGPRPNELADFKQWLACGAPEN